MHSLSTHSEHHALCLPSCVAQEAARRAKERASAAERSARAALLREQVAAMGEREAR